MIILFSMGILFYLACKCWGTSEYDEEYVDWEPKDFYKGKK